MVYAYQQDVPIGEDVYRKIRKDLDDKGVRVSDAELRKAMADFLHTALEQIEGEGKSKSS